MSAFWMRSSEKSSDLLKIIQLGNGANRCTGGYKVHFPSEFGTTAQQKVGSDRHHIILILFTSSHRQPTTASTVVHRMDQFALNNKLILVIQPTRLFGVASMVNTLWWMPT